MFSIKESLEIKARRFLEDKIETDSRVKYTKEVIEKFGVMDNGIHASDSEESGKREISLWFGNSYLSPSSSNELPHFKEWLKNRCS